MCQGNRKMFAKNWLKKIVFLTRNHHSKKYEKIHGVKLLKVSQNGKRKTFVTWANFRDFFILNIFDFFKCLNKDHRL